MKLIRASLLVLTLLLGLFFLWPLPSPTEKTVWFFYDQSGEVLYQESAVSSLSTEPPSFLLESLVTLEDQNFYQHGGVDVKALLRAISQNIASQEIVSGASTLTMQLARLEILPNTERNWWYKVRQAFWALKLEQKLTKIEILNRYLAQVNLGNGAYGFENAARRYFSKDLHQLSVGELSTLLAIIQNPSQFNPIANPERALERRNFMLSRLEAAAVIDTETYKYWVKNPLIIKPEVNNLITAPHFIFWLKSQLDFLEDESEEVHVYTTLDKKLYQDSLAIVQQNIKRNEKEKQLSNGAVVVLDPQNRLQLMIGSADFFDDTMAGAVNMATAYRQSGSVLKPFLYSLALDKGFSPADELSDLKTIFAEGYLPRNFSITEENGAVRFREALANSYNIAAVDLLTQVGIEPFYYFLEQLGLSLRAQPESLGLAMILGSAETSLLNLTQAYSVFTHQGRLNEVVFIDKATDAQGLVLYQPEPLPVKKVLSSSSAEWGQQVLSDDAARWKNFSRGNSLELPFPSGAKTGTSQAFRDNWVIGFSPFYTVGVWVGNANGAPMVASSGMQGAGPIWQGVMQRLHRDKPALGFEYTGDRVLSTACRRPQATLCAETVPVFLTAQERAALNQAPPADQTRSLKIIYPANDDTFVAGSDLLIQIRGTNVSALKYSFNKKILEGPIINNLPLGQHAIEVTNLDGETDKVQIKVENL